MSRGEREALVFGLAKTLKDLKELKLRAVAVEGFPRKPWPIAGFTPDVIAYDPEEELLQLGDVVTSNDLTTSLAEERLMAHARLAMASGASKGERVPLHVAVSVENNEELEELLEMLEIENWVTVWTTGQAIAC